MSGNQWEQISIITGPRIRFGLNRGSNSFRTAFRFSSLCLRTDETGRTVLGSSGLSRRFFTAFKMRYVCIYWDNVFSNSGRAFSNSVRSSVKYFLRVSLHKLDSALINVCHTFGINDTWYVYQPHTYYMVLGSVIPTLSLARWYLHCSWMHQVPHIYTNDKPTAFIFSLSHLLYWYTIPYIISK